MFGFLSMADVVFFRFAAALILVVLISMVGIGLEKQTLEMKRAVSRQYFQKDLLLELHAKQRLRIQQLTAPSQLSDLQNHSTMPADRESYPDVKNSEAGLRSHRHSARPRLPLLRWEHPVRNTSR